ncbi:MAG: histidine--tRNA ligase [Bacteroidota bacterium]|jgi:histidyl-tRNA synthetase
MKPSIPRGTRDFGPEEINKRKYIFDIIKTNFELFGFNPIETPTMENIETLTGKYGDEGDQLIYKVLNSRIHESKSDKKELIKKEFNALLKKSYNSELLTEKALRYDLTVPFARYVVMNHSKLSFPFKRYQIQPVWRADRPQKGRYREFYQCDADVIGSTSLINELELVQIIVNVFAQLGIPFLLKINNRKILSGIAEIIGEENKIIQITVAIDKLDKIGIEGVKKELNENGIDDVAISKLQPLLELSGNRNQKIERLRHFLAASSIGLKGIQEIEELFQLIEIANKNWNFERLTTELDITLARGLNYYTGTIFEVKANRGNFTPSILGGGRYDDLTGIFGLKNMSGVGISFGVDRIYDVLEELNLFPFELNAHSKTKLLIMNDGKTKSIKSIELAHKLRSEKINTEFYPDAIKLNKQFDYAEKKQIPFVLLQETNENGTEKLTLKNIQTGIKKEEVSIDQLIELLK